MVVDYRIYGVKSKDIYHELWKLIKGSELQRERKNS